MDLPVELELVGTRRPFVAWLRTPTVTNLQRYTSGMKIFLNGQSRECATATTVASLLAETGHGERRVAVEVNREIVPRSRHGQHELRDGDRVEIVQAIGGG